MPMSVSRVNTALSSSLERLGVNTPDQVAKLSTKKIAAVMVTTDLPPFVRSGSRSEREVALHLDKTNAVRLGLRNPDLTTARRIALAINKALGPVAAATDPRTVALNLSGHDPIEALAAISELRVARGTCQHPAGAADGAMTQWLYNVWQTSHQHRWRPTGGAARWPRPSSSGPG
jgi:flagellar basal body P-ring protein FlgI